jgi:hypothetical protein
MNKQNEIKEKEKKELRTLRNYNTQNKKALSGANIKYY